ncbi:histidine kinase dimerization/phospho-acceptor domain-containing protein, partial [Avibacterium avium]
VLKGYLELLAETQPTNALYNKAIQAMQEQSQRMSHLLDQLSLLAKIEHSNNEHYPVNLSEIIHSLQKNTFILNANSQRLVFDIAPNLTILGDENQLQSA